MARLRSLAQELKQDPTIQEIAEQMGLDEIKVKKAPDIIHEPISLGIPVDEMGSELVEFIEDKGKTPLNVVIDDIMIEKLRDALNILSLREKTILEMRYGLGVYNPHTLEEVGKYFHVARERIRQIEAKSIRRLR